MNWMDEEAIEKLKENREPVEAPTSHYIPKPEEMGKLLWFSGKVLHMNWFLYAYVIYGYKIKGPPGAGKSTTAGRLAKEHGFVYYEADSFFMFCNPFINPNQFSNQLATISQKPVKVKCPTFKIMNTYTIDC